MVSSASAPMSRLVASTRSHSCRNCEISNLRHRRTTAGHAGASWSISRRLTFHPTASGSISPVTPAALKKREAQVLPQDFVLETMIPSLSLGAPPLLLDQRPHVLKIGMDASTRCSRKIFTTLLDCLAQNGKMLRSSRPSRRSDDLCCHGLYQYVRR